MGNRREGEYFRQRNLTRGGGSRRGGVASLRSLSNDCLGARPQGRTFAERPSGEGNRAVAWGLVLEWRSACGRLLEARLVSGRRFRDAGTITNESRSGCTYGLFQFPALLLQIFHAKQVILLHAAERPGFVLLIFLRCLLHGLLVA